MSLDNLTDSKCLYDTCKKSTSINIYDYYMCIYGIHMETNFLHVGYNVKKCKLFRDIQKSDTTYLLPINSPTHIGGAVVQR